MIVYALHNVICMPIVALWRILTLLGSGYGLFNVNPAIAKNPFIVVVHDWTLPGYHIAIGTLPLSVFFLTLERCFAIQLANRFTTNMKMAIFIVNIVSSPGIPLISYLITYNGNIWPLKMTVGFLNTLACIFVIWKIRATKSSANDSIVRITSIMEFCLEFLPNLIHFIQTQLGYVYYAISALHIVTQCLNAAICAIVYSRVLTAKQKIESTAVSVLASTSTGNKRLSLGGQ
ncbi:hypothetical protein DdX_12814 [Ditylenchus destructor]|uniref:Uncharacterized protein n=1 Tax=Ditylenchus destructor TaxID=166010 RepID=A0AAD4R038_9BILA|nr:hypothetical protein DdX_12814 [Ditylenchus destructor]